MNSVSWFIYVAQVSNSLGMMFVALGTIGFVVIGFFTLLASIHSSIDTDKITIRTVPTRYFAAATAFLILGNIMPARDTMFAIAASQVGEQIVKNEAVQGIAGDATKALQQWIKRQIDPKS